MKAHLRTIRISPKKLNVVADLIRGKDVGEALTLLRFVPKKGARFLANAIRSAQANAEHNEKADPGRLVIQHVVVNKGPVLKRSRFGSRSRIKPLRKPTAHISIILAAKP
jgi:large subunit ribosomal protein L22